MSSQWSFWFNLYITVLHQFPILLLSKKMAYDQLDCNFITVYTEVHSPGSKTHLVIDCMFSGASDMHK